jgi:hypothetical protein
LNAAGLLGNCTDGCVDRFRLCGNRGRFIHWSDTTDKPIRVDTQSNWLDTLCQPNFIGVEKLRPFVRGDTGETATVVGRLRDLAASVPSYSIGVCE